MMADGYILLIEDEMIVQEYNKKILERFGYSTKLAFTLSEARTLISKDMPRAIILDIQLPDGSGLEFLQEIRAFHTIPVLLLTAMGTPQDVIKGLELGGDDYLAKPYDLTVFLRRVEALLRRSYMIPQTLRYGPLRLNPATGKAFLNGEDMSLSQKEYLLLQQLVLHPEEVLEIGYLTESAWGERLVEIDSSIKNTIYRLRKGLEGSGYVIALERGEGYVLERE